MLEVEILQARETEKAARIFHRDSFVLIRDALMRELGYEEHTAPELGRDCERVG